MRYWIWLKNGDLLEDWTLPGLIPDRTFDLMVCSQVPELCGLCKICPWGGTICHVIEADTGRKMCPVLFHETVKPKWRIEDLHH